MQSVFALPTPSIKLLLVLAAVLLITAVATSPPCSSYIYLTPRYLGRVTTFVGRVTEFALPLFRFVMLENLSVKVAKTYRCSLMLRLRFFPR